MLKEVFTEFHLCECMIISILDISSLHKSLHECKIAI